MTTIGQGNAFGVGLMAVIVGVIIAILVASSFLKNKTKKSIVYVFAAGIIVFGSAIAMIADPIAVKIKCSKFTTLEEYRKAPSQKTIGCIDKKNELEMKAAEEKAKQKEEEDRKIKEAKEACLAKEYDWNDFENRCNTKEEQRISILRKECYSKNYNWNYEADRCNNDDEQRQYEQKIAEDKARREAEEAKRKEEEARREAERKEDEKKQQDAVTQPSTPAASNKPSIDTIADACWAYGRLNGVHLTDYASTDIKQDGDYYQIVMWHNDRSTWKCWYNPSDKDVFVEKVY